MAGLVEAEPVTEADRAVVGPAIVASGVAASRHFSSNFFPIVPAISLHLNCPGHRAFWLPWGIRRLSV